MIRTAHPSLRQAPGFTLLEVLVALSILGIAVTIVFQLFSADLKAIGLSEHYVSASVRGETRMSEILDDDKLMESAWRETTVEGYTVDVVVRNTLQERTAELPVQLLEIMLTLYWKKDGREKSMTFRSMKMIMKKV